MTKKILRASKDVVTRPQPPVVKPPWDPGIDLSYKSQKRNITPSTFPSPSWPPTPAPLSRERNSQRPWPGRPKQSWTFHGSPFGSESFQDQPLDFINKTGQLFLRKHIWCLPVLCKSFDSSCMEIILSEKSLERGKLKRSQIKWRCLLESLVSLNAHFLSRHHLPLPQCYWKNTWSTPVPSSHQETKS